MTHEPNALKAGTDIAGYEIVRALGAGGFGITYEAASPFTGKRVAIKEFFPRGIASREGNTRIVYAERDAEVVRWALKRFETSTLDQCSLKHPNIVDVIHYVKANGTGYMIMEYVEGNTLDAWLREREFPPSPQELRPLTEPVFAALVYLHAQNMIHRDIAPDNIMIRADGRPVIIDFGAIKLIEQATQIRSRSEKSFMVAKQFYSPPEQMEPDGELDERADIYSLGAVLYRAFAGRPPSNADDRMQKLAFGKPDPFVPLAELAPELPPAFAGTIDAALSFNAEHRPASVLEFFASLDWDGSQHAVATTPLLRDKSHPVPSGTSRNRRSIWPWLLPLAGLVAIAIGVAIFTGSIPIALNKPPPAKSEPLPKMDTMEVPEKPVFTPPAPAPQPDGNPQPPADEPAPNQNRQ